MGWIDTLKDYAPHIASAIVSGGATLPSLALKAISDATGTEIKDETEAKAAIESATPEQLIKIKQADNSFKIRMRELDNELVDTELKDIQQARDSHKHSKMPAVITCVMTLLAAIYGAALFFIDMPDKNRDMVTFFGGQLITIWVSSIVYWVGTTRSSAEKTRKLTT